MNDDTRFDRLLRALSDGTRRTLLDRLRDAPGQTLGELIAGLPQTRQALSKHLAVLEEADLVVPLWRGREKRHYLNPAPLRALPSRWVTSSPQDEAAALRALQQALAAPPPPARAGQDPVETLLLAPPAAVLQGQAVADVDTLAAACAYLAGTVDAVQAVLKALPATAGYARPPAGGFSLVEHLAHLADLETLGWRPRFERILQERRPRLPGVDGDRLAAERDYQAHPWRGAARRFCAERRRSLALLRHYDAEVLQRPVTFAGARTRAGGVVAAAVAHDLDHRPAMAEAWRLTLKETR